MVVTTSKCVLTNRQSSVSRLSDLADKPLIVVAEKCSNLNNLIDPSELVGCCIDVASPRSFIIKESNASASEDDEESSTPVPDTLNNVSKKAIPSYFKEKISTSAPLKQ